jgi:hypothetical protein
VKRVAIPVTEADKATHSRRLRRTQGGEPRHRVASLSSRRKGDARAVDKLHRAPRRGTARRGRPRSCSASSSAPGAVVWRSLSRRCWHGARTRQGLCRGCPGRPTRRSLSRWCRYAARTRQGGPRMPGVSGVAQACRVGVGMEHESARLAPGPRDPGPRGCLVWRRPVAEVLACSTNPPGLAARARSRPSVARFPGVTRLNSPLDENGSRRARHRGPTPSHDGGAAATAPEVPQAPGPFPQCPLFTGAPPYPCHPRYPAPQASARHCPGQPARRPRPPLHMTVPTITGTASCASPTASSSAIPPRSPAVPAGAGRPATPPAARPAGPTAPRPPSPGSRRSAARRS